MTIKLQNASNVTNVKGIHTTYNNKPVLCITTGEVFASVSDAAHSVGSSVGTMSCALHHNGTFKGKRWCYLANSIEHLDELTANIRSTEEKLADYEAMKAKRENIKKAKAAVKQHQANVAELRRKLDEEIALMESAQAELDALIYEDDYYIKMTTITYQDGVEYVEVYRDPMGIEFIGRLCLWHFSDLPFCDRIKFKED